MKNYCRVVSKSVFDEIKKRKAIVFSKQDYSLHYPDENVLFLFDADTVRFQDIKGLIESCSEESGISHVIYFRANIPTEPDMTGFDHAFACKQEIPFSDILSYGIMTYDRNSKI